MGIFRRRPARPDSVRLRVNPIACEGIGMCAHLAPGLVRVDSWGYPVIRPEPLSGRDLAAARAGVRGCPRRALFLD
ncbi:MAG: ferredoxin [Actinomycetales bacterium]